MIKQAHEENGEDLPDWWPRPEDISIHPGRLTEIRGPSSPEEELPHYERLVKLRDAWIAKTRYDTVVFKTTHKEDGGPHDHPALGFLAYMLDLMLPKRMQLSHDGIHERLMAAFGTSYKRLEDELAGC